MGITTTKGFGFDRIKALIIGESGAGKTYLASTLKDKTLIVSAESGLLTLKEFEIDVWDITSSSGVLVPREKRIDEVQKVYAYLCTKESDKYSNVFIDSITEIANLLFYTVEMEMKNKALLDNKNYNPIQCYGEYAKRLTSLVTHFRDLPGKNVFFTALPNIKSNDGFGDEIRIGVPGQKPSVELPGLLDEIFYLKVVEEDNDRRRVLLTKPTAHIPNLKDRSGELSEEEPADLDLVLDKIYNKNNKGDENAK